MSRFYVKWWAERSPTSTKPDEMFKLGLMHLQMVRADLKARALNDWGCVPDGASGYTIMEAKSVTELADVLLKYAPFIHFEVTPVLTVDQFYELACEAVKKATAAAKK
jgi:uncharacterized protein (DUF885 family)